MYDQLHVICLILDVLFSKLTLNSRIYIFFRHFQLEKPKEGYTLKDSGPDSPQPAMVSIVPLCFLFFLCGSKHCSAKRSSTVRYVSAQNLFAKSNFFSDIVLCGLCMWKRPKRPIGS